jgi:hypothetical protein
MAIHAQSSTSPHDQPHSSTSLYIPINSKINGVKHFRYTLHIHTSIDRIPTIPVHLHPIALCIRIIWAGALVAPLRQVAPILIASSVPNSVSHNVGINPSCWGPSDLSREPCTENVRCCCYDSGRTTLVVVFGWPLPHRRTWSPCMYGNSSREPTICMVTNGVSCKFTVLATPTSQCCSLLLLIVLFDTLTPTWSLQHSNPNK